MLKVPNSLKKHSIKIVNKMVAVFVIVVFILIIRDAFVFAQNNRNTSAEVQVSAPVILIKDSTDLVQEREKTEHDSIKAVMTIQNTRNDIIETLKAKNDSLEFYRSLVGKFSYIYQN
jgi:uncharacterized protein YlxW (UPF0749 family)